MNKLLNNISLIFLKKFQLLYIICIVILICYFLTPIHIFKKDPIYIGVAAPMSGEKRSQSIEMLKGINLCCEMINKKGGIKKRPIALITKDDKNDKSVAMKVASEFALDDRIVLILGHYLSSTSIVAGNIYQKSGIPVITASSASENIAFGNEWYFSMIPSNSFQSDYVLHYIKSYLKTNNATIIVDTNEYENKSLAEKFKLSASSVGIEIKKVWEIDSSLNNTSDRIKTISTELQFIDSPGAIFIASQAKEAVKIITAIKKLGAKYDIIGPGSFTNRSFIANFNQYPRERAMKGYYSDNIHVFVPYIPELNNVSIYNFNKAYLKKHHQSPSWIAAGYHDAMRVAAEAIKKALNDSNEPISQIRQKVRKKISEFNCNEKSISGFSGPIYFNDNGVVERSIKFGIYKNQQLVPSYTQFYILPEQENVISNHDKDSILTINKKRVQKSKTVYTGIEFIDILNIDMEKLICHAKLHLWFRYKGNFNHGHIVFSNAVHPIKLDTKIFTETHNDITTVLYTVIEQFRINADFTFFPFDRHTVKISFHHAEDTKDKLIYVSDKNQNIKSKDIFFNGFDITDIQMFQSIYVDDETSQFENLSDLNTFSEFNIKAEIKRADIFFPFRYLIPLFISIFIIILSYYVKNYQKYYLVLTSFIITGILNMKVFQAIATTDIMHIKLFFFTSYLCIIINVLILIVKDRKNRIRE
jgi:branched-chain amino acid transport system substrate-binding protein